MSERCERGEQTGKWPSTNVPILNHCVEHVLYRDQREQANCTTRSYVGYNIVRNDNNASEAAGPGELRDNISKSRSHLQDDVLDAGPLLPYVDG